PRRIVSFARVLSNYSARCAFVPLGNRGERRADGRSRCTEASGAQSRTSCRITANLANPAILFFRTGEDLPLARRTMNNEPIWCTIVLSQRLPQRRLCGLPEYLIGIDAGTSVVKCVLYDTAGRQLARAAANTAVARPRPGWC